MSLPDIADANLARLRANPYPGRGIVLGLDEDGARWVQVYWVMGRSANSRNRVLEVEGAEVSTAPHDPSKVEAPSLIIYRAMSSFRGWHVVTNGDHTDSVVQHIAAGSTFETALEGCRHEPDAPNYTPRIAGLVRLNGQDTELKLAKILLDPGDPEHSVHCFYRYAGFVNGFGACIHTYAGDGNPVPPFESDPYPLPLPGAIEEIADAYWDALDTDNKVALAVKTVHCDSGRTAVTVRNKLT